MLHVGLACRLWQGLACVLRVLGFWPLAGPIALCSPTVMALFLYVVCGVGYPEI